MLHLSKDAGGSKNVSSIRFILNLCALFMIYNPYVINNK